MKILYISRSIMPSRTANSINVMKMCSTFASMGHEVILLAPWTRKLEEKGIDDIFKYYGVEENFKLKKLFSPNIKYIKKRIYSLRCWFIAKKIQPDIVYGRDDMLAFYLAQRSGFYTIFEKHGPKDKDFFNNFFFDKFMKYKKDVKMIVNSNELRKIYSNSCSIGLDCILAANNGTNKIPDKTIPENIKINKNRIQVGYVGSLFQGRGIDTIIELAKRLQDIDFHIIGGNEKDIIYWKSKINFKNLIFHGFVQPNETYKYRNICDILLAPYQGDTEGNKTSKYMSPMKLFEYMASNKVIICSDLKVIYETLDKESAIFVDSLNIDEWEKAIVDLSKDKDKRDKLSNKAYLNFLNNFTWESRVKKILDFIELD